MPSFRGTLQAGLLIGLIVGGVVIVGGCGKPKTGEMIVGKAPGQDAGEAASREHMLKMMKAQAKKRR